MSDKLVYALAQYRRERATKKITQRVELEDYLEPWLADVGTEIRALRADGKSVEQVCDIMGIQNRTFVYKALNASQDYAPHVEPEAVTVHEGNGEGETAPYMLEYYEGVVRVVFPDDEVYELVMVDGVPDVPEEWADHSSARRALYKAILTEVRKHGKQG